MVSKGRQPRTRGEAQGLSKLTDAAVRAIRRSEGVSQKTLAARFGVHQSLISLVKSGKIWMHIK
jgi:ribosome-binding protein aMBF1 (putative translation factor)